MPSLAVSGSSRPASSWFCPAFRGSGSRLHCSLEATLRVRNGYAAPTIGRRLNVKTRPRFRIFTFFTLAIFFLLTCASCSDSEPSIAKVEHNVIFDYQDDSSAPYVRFSVFVQPRSSALRAGEIRTVHAETGMEWYCPSPLVFHGGDGKDYVGCTSFVPAYKSAIPQGIYYVYYKDLSDRECEGEFSLNFNPDFETKAYVDLPYYIANPNNERIALYNTDGILIYCNKRRDEWKDNAAILAEYGTADRMRVCYESGTLFFMLPFESLQKQ